MANLGKKWGAVLACWAVALVLVIAGICMGLVIPSSAADEYKYEGDIRVEFDADKNGVIDETETKTYHSFIEALTAIKEFNTTAENQATIKLLSDVSLVNLQDGAFGFLINAKHITIDLNGHYLRDAVGYYGESNNTVTTFFNVHCNGSLTFIDSDPTALHYCSFNSGKGVYTFSDTPEIGEPNTPVRGGIIAAQAMMFYVGANDGYDDQAFGGTINFNAGTYVAKIGAMQLVANAHVVIEDGVTWQVNMDATELGIEDATAGTKVAMFVVNGGPYDYGDSTLTINGGTIYGEVYCMNMREGGNDPHNPYVTDMERVDLTKERNDGVIKVKGNMKKVEIEDGVYAYTSADEDAGTTPNKPIADANSTNDNNNLIALIVLGAAAAVMVVGVAVIIILNNKRRKKVA